MIDYLIVGVGITGATLARVLTDSGASCLVIDKRNHIGGNCYDVPHDDYFINQYGGHIFHTNNKPIWDFVNRFSEWLPYEHRVKANYQGKIYTLPPNAHTIKQVGSKATIRRMFFEGYSFKQWGMALEDLPGGVLARIPIRNDYDDRYFSDKYQGMPQDGYTALIQNMFDGVPVELGTTYPSERLAAKQVIYTGSLDALYGYEYGRLPYRSLRWETEYKQQGIGCATMNYTDYTPSYTRRMEWQYFGHRQKPRKETAVTTEYPEAYDGTNLPIYPINTPENNALHKRYATRAAASGLLFSGRLANYRYMDMHQAIGAALKMAGELCA